MINIFNRTVLFRDTDAEAAAKVWSALRERNIPYEMKTKTGTTSIERQLKQSANIKFMSGGLSSSTLDGPERSYLYIIFVRKRDLERAKEACGL